MNTAKNTKKIIIIGAGIGGVTLARSMAEKNYSVEIYEERAVVGGHCHDTYDASGVLYHKYGPHIFHTDKQPVADFVTRFAKFNNYRHNVVAKVGRSLIELPITFRVLKSLYPTDANKIIAELNRVFFGQAKVSILDVINTKNPILTEPFQWIFTNIYQPYSEKMWGMPIHRINRSVLGRVSVVLNETSTYFPTAIFQGLPIGGYTKMMEKMLDHPKIHLYPKTDARQYLKFATNQLCWKNHEATFPIVYCGSLDRLFNYRFGFLAYRSLEFQFVSFPKTVVQKFGVINYPNHPTMTRSVEYKYLTQQAVHGASVVSREYPGTYNPHAKKWNYPYYPLTNPAESKMYQAYLKLLENYPNFYLLGRLAQYRYFDMDDVIDQALCLSKKIAL